MFGFLKDFAGFRFTPVLDLDDVPWKLSFDQIPTDVKAFPSQEESGSSGKSSDTILIVRRPKSKQPPELPVILQEWVGNEIDNPTLKPQLREARLIVGSDDQRTKELFSEDPRRIRAWQDWLKRWHQWAEQEQRTRSILEIYNRLYELHTELQREGERYELVLAEGILSWKWEENRRIYFPLILLPVQLEFVPNSELPQFVVRDVGLSPRLYTTALRHAPLPHPDLLTSLRTTFAEEPLHPLARDSVVNFLKELVQRLSPEGQFLDRPPEFRELHDIHPPMVWRSPHLLLLQRSQGYLQTIERIIDHLQQTQDIPKALYSIIGSPQTEKPPQNLNDKDPNFSQENSDLDILRDTFFVKPWNKEQLEIARRLTKEGAVLVQGPPGTGKTHTIANLIAHLLAEGKSVLVTAYTSKALRVLREHIPPSLRSLAVSVLDDELVNRQQLEEAVRAIVERLSENPEALHQQARRLLDQREELLERIAELRLKLIESISAEYRPIVVGGREFPPSEAAKFVAAGTGIDDWIPGPIEGGANLPLSREEVIELYKLNEYLDQSEEAELSYLSDSLIAQLPTPEKFAQMVSVIREYPGEGSNLSYWKRSLNREEINLLEQIARESSKLVATFSSIEGWLIELAEREQLDQFYTLVIEPAKALFELEKGAVHLLIEHQPSLPSWGSLEQHEQMASELYSLAKQQGGQLSYLSWSVLLSPPRRRFINSVRVSGRKPKTADEFKAIEISASIQRRRRVLRNAWNLFVPDKDLSQKKPLGPTPERTVLELQPDADRLRELLLSVAHFKQQLIDLGLDWERAVGATPRLKTVIQFLGEQLPVVVDELKRFFLYQEAVSERGIILEAISNAHIESQTIATIKEALKVLDVQSYQKGYERIQGLLKKRAAYSRRKELIQRLKNFAPTWAEYLLKRVGVHGESVIPGDPERAWLWRQLQQELELRSKISVQEIQDQLEFSMKDLYRVTEEFVEKRAWAFQIQKTGHRERQALVGWLNTIRRLGKGKGRLASKLRTEATRLLSQAKSAVPIWIMPLTRVAEQIDPSSTRFDVVIVDEASQCDILGLITFYLGNNIVVVGDNQQVSPEGIGQELEVIKQLQSEYLMGALPNAHLYDGRRSIYDIALESFPGQLMLTEHFRCVPEIVAFSNKLCYGGRIRPLRESARVPTKPHVVPLRVRGVHYQKKNKEEAVTIVSLVLSMLKHPIYANKSIGVISLLGEEQAKLIEAYIRRFASEDPLIEMELEKRKFLAGTAAQFQGDERDIILISLVDSPRQEGPLPIRNDDRFKQRYNVATTRARDQLWVVYSLDSAIDLKEGDLRKELIEFAHLASKNPEKVLNPISHLLEQTESPFEQEVLTWLVNEGYKVYPQWQVGIYRIDLVVEYEGQRVAIECDGDRWHPIEKIPEDLERQVILERVGWRFIRIRGSEFYWDRKGTMERVIQRLNQMGIRPTGQFPFNSSEKAEKVNSFKTEPLLEEILRKAEELRKEAGFKIRDSE